MNDDFEKTVQEMQSLQEAALLTGAADLVLQQYALSAPDMGAARFDFFCRTFSRCATRSENIGYYAAELALARRAMLKNGNDHPELFDEVRQQVFYGDAEGLEKLIATLTETVPARAFISPGFETRTRQFLKEQVTHYSFTDRDIAGLQQKLSLAAANDRLARIWENAVAEIGEIHRSKRERDLDGLNRWSFQFQSDDLLKKLSFRNTYVNLAYERLVREHEIKNIRPEDYCRQHRLKVQKQINDLTGTTDAKGRQICRKYAINKVYKAVAGQDKFKLQSVWKALEKYQDESFYADTAAILTALDGGAKNRDVRLPRRPYRQYD